MSAHIAVIGAGVIGLQTAASLLEAGFKVTIIAKQFPGDESIEYTSPWAGAIWRTHSSPDQKEQCQWDLESYHSWMNAVDSDEKAALEMGLKRRPISVYSGSSTQSTADTPWFAPHVENFSIIPPSALPPNCTSGHTYTSIAVNPPIYISHLLAKANSLGAHTIRADLPSSSGLSSAISAALSLLLNSTPSNSNHGVPIVVNCTGLSSHTLVPDPTVYPIRGQTLLARITPPPDPSTLGIFLREDPAISPLATYIFPRPGTDLFVLGGTKTSRSWDAEPDEWITKGIIERCRNVWPEMRDSGIEVVATQVGLRPGREGGVRIEVENVDVELDGRVNERKGKENGTVRVVHQYGHAGAGYQLSLGSAGKVVRIVKELVGMQ
ncbi:hypothetical protein FB567DRAFT_152343 [Paraphoma chrysanthemicola]|uniref:FAD dependent oxidoreductase domain-containing protein n=1 Tax=Paraphoma chrysanthemicola TaxID=798071 RepID=A0A8K0VTX4_9PLEO|nr:hypothetical protein FB567DRAFT_152343 [Paraphoma chrysanthemicola]